MHLKENIHLTDNLYINKNRNLYINQYINLYINLYINKNRKTEYNTFPHILGKSLDLGPFHIFM
jgi:hypothetical protein